MSISIIIPVYNEEECIKRCLKEVGKTFSNIDYEIIVVNDGSFDRSHQIILEFTKNNRRVKYIKYAENRGYSYAIRKGFEKATKEYVSFIDADLQYPPEELLRMYNYAKKNRLDFLIGEPKRKYYNLTRSFLSFFYNLFLWILFGINLKDANSLKLMKRELLQKINLRFDYGMIEIETLLGFRTQGIPLRTFLIKVQKRIAGTSKCSVKLIFRTIRDCIKLKFSKNKLLKR